MPLIFGYTYNPDGASFSRVHFSKKEAMRILDGLLWIGILLGALRLSESTDDCDDAPDESVKSTCRQIEKWDKNTRNITVAPVPSARKSTERKHTKTVYECMDTSCLCNFYGRGLFHQCRFNKVVRKEYRVMSDDERNRYHKALWTIKNNGRYDQLTQVHSQYTLSPGAHSGPGFLPWHREFLKRLEFVIREVDPTVALPYWDSTLDSSIPDPSKSVLWSDELMGSQDSDGQMRRGAFKGWYTSDHTRYFKRNIGAKGQLLIGSVVSNLINGGTLRDILSFTARSQYCSERAGWGALEYIHGGPHVYTGGDMEYIPISTNDPLFFNHHCMIDLIWEQWRQKHQTERERETSYPPDNEACSSSAHYGNVQMVPFYPFTNRDGLSNKYTGNLYEYAPRPTCSQSKPNGCGSKYLFCDFSHGTPRCASKIMLGGRCDGYNSNEQQCYGGVCHNGYCTKKSPEPKPTTPPRVNETCFNENQCCEPWAQRGECRNNPSYMTSKCKASCGICTPTTYSLSNSFGKCVNLYRDCRAMFLRGDCENNVDWMKTNCRQACNLCNIQSRC
ncbi:hypothetical protein RB195_008209 [Necator americanus]|uniref:ShKT domain-containing protein n=1 Tax=Necator americanus TaxID=51031 RepID=A0ABR1CMH9_NECAM